MRSIRRQFPAGWLVVAGLFPIGPTTLAADEPRPGADGDRMAAIVAAVRAEEAKYRDIEYVARIVVRDSTRKDPTDPADVTTLATRRVVLQGDRSYLRFQAFERMQGTKARRELVSAYDGERTRTVTAGNCANIHLGRFPHPEIFPAHGLPLAHYKLNFPLSVYLSGTQAIHAHLQYPREIVETGSPDTFAKVEAHFEGEEPVDGLRCLKVRLTRRYGPNEEPLTQDLWLAPERHYRDFSANTTSRSEIAGRDHARECVVRTRRTSSNLGREPDPRRRSHSRARLEVPRPNHGLTTVVTWWC